MPTQTVVTEKSSTVVSSLSTLLADTYALFGQTQVAHWNVEGSAFFELHQAFQAQYEDLFIAVDDIAERIRALNSYAIGGLSTLADASSIVELAIEATPAKDYVAHLIEGNEIVVATAMKTRKAAEGVNDLETQDMVIKRIQTHQKVLWMLRSYLKNK